MNICPQCKEQLPLLSKICPVCGYVAPSKEGELTAEEIAEGLENGLVDLKSIPVPSFTAALKHMWFVPMTILAVAMIMLAIIGESGMFMLLALLFSVWSIVLIIRNVNKKTAYHQNEQLFKETLSEMETLGRQALRSYPNSSEIKTLVRNVDTEVSEVQHSRKQSFKKGVSICWAVIIITCIAVGYSLFVVDLAVNDVEPTTEQTSVEPTSENNNE